MPPSLINDQIDAETVIPLIDLAADGTKNTQKRLLIESREKSNKQPNISASLFAGLDGQMHLLLPWINPTNRRKSSAARAPRVFPPVSPRHCVLDAMELLWPLMTNQKVKSGQWSERRQFEVRTPGWIDQSMNKLNTVAVILHLPLSTHLQS